MTDRTQPEAGSTHLIRYALELGLLWIDGSGRNKVCEALDALDAIEAKLASIGAAHAQAHSAAPVEVADAMADSQYLAGVSAGWNAANADDPNEALRKLHESRAGYLKPIRTAARALADSAAPAWEHHARKLTQWLYCMSHNDSYFGEPAGLVKQVTGELNRLIGAAPQQEAQEPVGKYLTVVYRDLTRDEAQALIDHEKMSAASWSHALHERDMAKAASQPAPAPLSDDVVKDAARYRWLRTTTNFATNSQGERIDVRNQPEKWDAAIDAALAAQGGKA